MRGRIIIGVVAANIVLCGAVAALWSMSYWDYLFAPPPASNLTNEFAAVDGVHLIKLYSSGAMGVFPEATIPLAPVMDYPPSRILDTLPGTPQISATPLTDEQQTAVLSVIQDSRLLSGDIPQFNTPLFRDDGTYQYANSNLIFEPGSPDYILPFRPGGYLVEGTNIDGTPLLLAALTSTQITNDHYRYDELLFEVGADGALTPRDQQGYYYDIAGIEGITFPVVWLGLTFLGGVGFLGIAVVYQLFNGSSTKAKRKPKPNPANA